LFELLCRGTLSVLDDAVWQTPRRPEIKPLELAFRMARVNRGQISRQEKRMNDETRFKAEDFDEPSVLVGLTKAEIDELVARDYKRVDQWHEQAWLLDKAAKKAQAEGAPNAAALRFVANNADQLRHAAVDHHKALLGQTPDSWPKPRRAWRREQELLTVALSRQK
jgi:hypothetical protein